LPWWKGSPDHFSLRLQAAGVSKWGTDLAAWAAAGLLCAAAVGLGHCRLSLQLILLAGVAAGLGCCGLLLLRWEVSRRGRTPPAGALERSSP
jgi:UDP-GlcNAc:undecaprenyl-phosphate GlcNAc-1-phosphate transferase